MGDRPHHDRDKTRVHLPVPIELYDNIRTFFQSSAIPLHDGTAHPQVLRQIYDLDAPVAAVLLDMRAALFRTGVVYTEHSRNFIADVGDHIEHLGLDSVARNHYGDFWRSVQV